MFIVLLRFSANKNKAGQLMEDHKAWLRRGFEDGVFLLAGSLEPEGGGGILAYNTSLAALQERVNKDPFVIENVVKADLFELDPGRVDPRLEFLVS